MVEGVGSLQIMLDLSCCSSMLMASGAKSEYRGAGTLYELQIHWEVQQRNSVNSVCVTKFGSNRLNFKTQLMNKQEVQRIMSV